MTPKESQSRQEVRKNFNKEFQRFIQTKLNDYFWVLLITFFSRQLEKYRNLIDLKIKLSNLGKLVQIFETHCRNWRLLSASSKG